MTAKLPLMRWQIASQSPEQLQQLIGTGLDPLMAKVLINRGITGAEQALAFIDPEIQTLPPPKGEFPDLETSVNLLCEAITAGDTIAICGDYDADGMTSTALLWRALTHVGAKVTYAIPSRMKDGYGINNRIVEEFAEAGVGLIITVDNGIAAYEPILLAVELGLNVIITDHHEVPPVVPPANAILNPKLIDPASPYRGLAGVGVAYILAVTTASQLNQLSGLTAQLLELFTLGTIADLAPLVGVNRRWLRRGLKRLVNSQIPGVQALIQVAGVSDTQLQLQPDDIGFRLGPRINAVGRIGDPQTVIELLTTDDPGIAFSRASQCEQTNRHRQQLCEQIEAEATGLIETTPIAWQQARVLVVVHPHWHHGVIGIVASRLVERYGVPVFIATDEGENSLRGSARGIEEFHVYNALAACDDLLEKYGGHRAAGGFSLVADNLEAFQQRLSEFAHQCLQPEHLKPLIKIDAQVNFAQIDLELYQQIDSLQPWGIGNDFPVFWTPQVRVLQQKVVGKNHLKLVLMQLGQNVRLEAIAWRWGQYYPLPELIDIAYKLKQNFWQQQQTVQLELIGVRLSDTDNLVVQGRFDYQGRDYLCSYWHSLEELRIKNGQGLVLAVRRGQKNGLLGKTRETADRIDVTQSPYAQIIKTARQALQI